MKLAYWMAALCSAGFISFAHCHTDELPIVLGSVLILACLLGALSPRHFFATLLLTGTPMFLTETMVHYGLITAPYPPGSGIPFVALVALVPAVLGTAAGAGMRRLTGISAVR